MKNSLFPLSSLLGILFIGLKLTMIIDWSWWLVLLPIYGPIVIWALVVVALLITIGALYATEHHERRKRAGAQ